jgi:hypothetical protein
MTMPTDDEINAVLDDCLEAFDSGRSKWPGMTYEQGVESAVRWMMDDGPNPLDD